MAAEQLPADAQAAVTRAAVNLVKAARAGMDNDAYIGLVTSQMLSLRRAWPDLDIARLFAALITAQAHVAARLADLADQNPDAPARRYLDELGGLAAHGTE